MSPISRALRAALALTLLCSPRAATAAPPLLERGPPAEPGATCAASQQAVTSIGAGKYREAARLYEQCARATNEPGLWKKAGMARYSARQFAQTIHALTAAQAAGGGDAQVEAILEDARKHAVTLRFAVAVSPGGAAPERLRVAARDAEPGDGLELPWPASAAALDVWLDPGPWTAEISLEGGGRIGPQDLRAVDGVQDPQVVLFRVEAPAAPIEPPVRAMPVDVELTLAPAAAAKRGASLRWSGPPGTTKETIRTSQTRWQLAPGVWQLEVEAPRFVPRGLTLELQPGQASQVTLKLQRTRMEKARIGLAATSGGVGLGLLVGGLALVSRGRRDYRAVAGELDGSGRPAAGAALRRALPAIRELSTGTMMSTAALGAGVAAITVAAEGSDRVLAIEAGVGGVLLVTGLAWLVPAKRRYADTPGGMSSPDRAFLDARRRPELAAAGLLGLGAGLAAAATLSLITRAVLRRGERSRKISHRAVPRVAGFGLQGNF